MGWKETYKLDQRIEFVNRALTEKISFTELCKEYGISRKTGYKWKQRFLEGGYPNLDDMTTRPHNSPNQLSEDDVILILQLKQAHPTWGARKIEQLIKNKYTISPSESSIKRVFEKAGLVKKRRVRRVDTSVHTLRKIIQPEEPNDVWTVDFKGWWMCDDRTKCNPLTIRDDSSKYILDIRALRNQQTRPVKDVFEEVFKQNGLPKFIRSDNGSPFACNNSILGLTRLSAWWISLGILPNRIDPGKPYQNGGHERMHSDIKKEIQRDYKTNLNVVQKVFDSWREEFNYVRPHESLGMKTPSDFYISSPRKYKGDIDDLIYPLGMQSRKVSSNGEIKVKNSRIPITSALSNYNVGLDEVENNLYNVWFSNFMLGTLDLRLLKFYPRDKWT